MLLRRLSLPWLWLMLQALPEAFCEDHQLTAQLPWKKGICKNEMQTLQLNFDAERFFNGIWYEEQSTGTFFDRVYRKCIQFETFLIGNVVNGTVSEYIPVIFSTIRSHVQITLEDKKIPSFKFKVPFLGITTVELQINLLGTDYDNYALLYTCSPALGLDGYISEMAFVMRRKWQDKSKLLEIRELSWKNGIPFEEFTAIDNSGC